MKVPAQEVRDPGYRFRQSLVGYVTLLGEQLDRQRILGDRPHTGDTPIRQDYGRDPARGLADLRTTARGDDLFVRGSWPKHVLIEGRQQVHSPGRRGGVQLVDVLGEA